jgi:hypothetical protein
MGGTVSSTTVRITTPPGQYRPGGTSSYTGLPSTPTEIASRPTSPTTPSTGAAPSNPTSGNSSVRTY